MSDIPKGHAIKIKVDFNVIIRATSEDVAVLVAENKFRHGEYEDKVMENVKFEVLEVNNEN